MSTPALYRTRITHLRRAPVHHYFEHHGYCWYVDVDELLRHRVDNFLAQHGVDLRGGKITALMLPRRRRRVAPRHRGDAQQVRRSARISAATLQ